MTQGEFDKLSEKYLAGDCSPEEIVMLEKLSDLNLDHDHAFESDLDARETEERLWGKIQSADDALRKNHGLLISKWAWLAAAASVALMLGYLYASFPANSTHSSPVAIRGIETKNIAHANHKVVLPDGSTVTLAENASLITEENYGKGTRTVYLTGEAFFDIEQNVKVPFLVHSGDLITEVLGTSFTIKPSNGSKTIEVSVKSGRVSVYASDPRQTRKFNGVIITPNQKVSYDVQNKTIRPEIVDKPEVIVPQTQVSDFQFEEATMDVVLALMQKTYGVEMVVANPVLNKCAFTGDLNGLSMYKQLDFVCGVINAGYEIRGTTIFITGKGCGD